MIQFKGNEESMRQTLLDFVRIVRYSNEHEPGKSDYDLAESYIKSQVSCEEGMDDFHKYCEYVYRKNMRILRAVKTVLGKTFHKHLKAYISNAEPIYWAPWEIVREPTGTLQEVSEYGRAIRQEWVDQWSVGTEGDSFEGIICVPLKPGRYLKFHYSC